MLLLVYVKGVQQGRGSVRRQAPETCRFSATSVPDVDRAPNRRRPLQGYAPPLNCVARPQQGATSGVKAVRVASGNREDQSVSSCRIPSYESGDDAAVRTVCQRHQRLAQVGGRSQFSRRSIRCLGSACNSPFSTRLTMSVSAALAGVGRPISSPLRTMNPFRNSISVRRPFTMS